MDHKNPRGRHPDVSHHDNLESALASEALPALLRKRGEPVFQDSWEAEAYAIGNILVKDGLIDSGQWMDLMAAAIRRAQEAGDPDCGDTYYHHWCAALESFCFQQQWISAAAYQELLHRWGVAIANTPHGVPLALDNAPRGPAAAADQQGDGHRADSHGSHHHQHGSHHHHHHHHHGPVDGPPPDHYWRPIHVTRLNG